MIEHNKVSRTIEIMEQQKLNSRVKFDNLIRYNGASVGDKERYLNAFTNVIEIKYMLIERGMSMIELKALLEKIPVKDD